MVFISVIVLCAVFHGEVIAASHPPQRICSQFFWICLCSDHLSAASQSRSAILSVICSTRSSSVFLRSLDLHGEVVSCFVMVVGAMVRSASAIGSLTCGSFQPGSLQRNRLPWRIPLGFSIFFCKPARFSPLVFFNMLLFPQCDSTWRAFLLSLVLPFLCMVLLGIFFSQRGFRL